VQSVVQNLNETYTAIPTSVAKARSSLAEFAGAAGATDRQVEAVRLAASEALTNSVLHAYRGEPGSIYVNAAVVSGELWMLISDDGCGLEPRADRPGLGLGLGLISQVSDDFTIAPRASGGTEVRIRFDLVSAEGEPAARPGKSEHRCAGRRSAEHRRPGFTPSMSAA
jgi:stage II sporulation protein AB (anti-sigma F factor)